MPIAIYTELHMECPHCFKPVRRGLRRFGPAKAKCYKCKEEFETGLPDIYAFSKTERVMRFIIEWIYPSYLRGFDQPAGILMWFAYIFLIGFAPLTVIPLFIWVAISKRDVGVVIPICIFSGLFYLQVLWFFRMIMESKKYHDTGEIPTWRSLIS